jgi:WD40 repeat protein
VGRYGDEPFSFDLDKKERLPSGPFLDFHNLIAITPQGHWLAQADPSTVREWDLRTGAELPSWHAPGGVVTATAFTPDGRRRMTLSWDGRGRLTDLSTGAQTPPFDLFDPQNVDAPRQFDYANFSPDGRLMAAVGGSSVGMWKTADLEKGGKVTPVAIVGGFTLAPHSVAFSPDGRRLAAGGDGREAVRLYDADSHLPVLTLAARGSIFQRIAFSPDGTVLAASNEEGELHLWRAPSWAEIEAAEGTDRAGGEQH